MPILYLEEFSSLYELRQTMLKHPGEELILILDREFTMWGQIYLFPSHMHINFLREMMETILEVPPIKLTIHLNMGKHYTMITDFTTIINELPESSLSYINFETDFDFYEKILKLLTQRKKALELEKEPAIAEVLCAESRFSNETYGIILKYLLEGDQYSSASEATLMKLFVPYYIEKNELIEKFQECAQQLRQTKNICSSHKDEVGATLKCIDLLSDQNPVFTEKEKKALTKKGELALLFDANKEKFPQLKKPFSNASMTTSPLEMKTNRPSEVGMFVRSIKKFIPIGSVCHAFKGSF